MTTDVVSFGGPSRPIILREEDIRPLTTVLIDGDIVAYRCAASCQKSNEPLLPVGLAIARANDLMQRIVHETGASLYNCYLTGSDNFRLKFNPDYKANRRDVPRPDYLQPVREYLVTEWKASVEDQQEADDALGIAQTQAIELGQDSVIASIDKDLLMIPGKHWNFVNNTGLIQTEVEAIRHFYWQLIMGDRSDNIFGYDGKARIAVPKFLEWATNYLNGCEREEDMFKHVRDMYNDDERLLMNGRCLWIRRQPDEVWEFPV